MRNTLVKALLAVSITLASFPSVAGGIAVVDMTAIGKSIANEAARWGQTATMIQNQVNMYANAIQNTLSLRDTAFAPLGNTLRSVYGVYMQGQSLMYRAQNLDSAFGLMYPSYQSYLYSMGQGGQTMGSLYQQWSDQGNQSVRTALTAAGIQVNAMDSDDTMLQRLILRSAMAGGQKSALQAGNEIAALNVQQMQRLQSLISTQLEMQANYIALQNQRQTVEDAWRQQFKMVRPTNTPDGGL
jgi:P-type conjugative transfer protein TrbJ